MTKTVNELTAGAKTDMDKVKAIFYYVSKNIRYMGLTPEKDRPGFEPHDVKITFGKKYGVCRDKAALLVSHAQDGGLELLSRAHQRRHEDGRGRARSVFQPRHRQRGIDAGQLCPHGPDR